MQYFQVKTWSGPGVRSLEHGDEGSGGEAQDQTQGAYGRGGYVNGKFYLSCTSIESFKPHES